MQLVTKAARILDFDTENRPGFYWYDGQCTDMLMCVSWKFIDEAEDVQSIVMYYDSEVGLTMPDLGAFVDALDEADAITGHNIKRHDLPLLNAYQLRCGFQPLTWPLVMDTMKMTGPSTKGVSRSQANLGEMLGIEEEKVTVHIPTWEAAAAGAPWALDVIQERCEQDVLMHIELFKELSK